MPSIRLEYRELLEYLVSTASTDIDDALDGGISKRNYYDSYGRYHRTGTNKAYWAFFALIIVVIALFLCCFNGTRKRRGQAPLYGTTYLTPQYYYNPNPTPAQTNQAPPQYTPEVGINDHGYYDQDGNFVVSNSNNTYPYKNESNTGNLPDNGLERPQEAYQRPEGPPPSTTTNDQQQPHGANQSYYNPPSGKY